MLTADTLRPQCFVFSYSKYLEYFEVKLALNPHISGVGSIFENMPSDSRVIPNNHYL